MLFSFFNASASFQSYINKIFAEKLNICVIVYFDDILIYTKNPSQLHIEVLHWILGQLRKQNHFANFKKSYFYQTEVQFLGFVNLAKKMSIKKEKIEAVKTYLEPQLLRDI